MLYVISGSENTRLAKQKQAAQIAKVARENLGGKLSISIDEYAAIKGIDREEALEYDLNCDGKISIGEEISNLYSQKILNREINPSIVMHAIYEAYGLRKLDSTINENLDILG